jgi:hypothetical protein
MWLRFFRQRWKRRWDSQRFGRGLIKRVDTLLSRTVSLGRADRCQVKAVGSGTDPSTLYAWPELCYLVAGVPAQVGPAADYTFYGHWTEAPDNLDR